MKRLRNEENMVPQSLRGHELGEKEMIIFYIMASNNI
jgi:hypothetical protein